MDDWSTSDNPTHKKKSSNRLKKERIGHFYLQLWQWIGQEVQAATTQQAYSSHPPSTVRLVKKNYGKGQDTLTQYEQIFFFLYIFLWAPTPVFLWGLRCTHITAHKQPPTPPPPPPPPPTQVRNSSIQATWLIYTLLPWYWPRMIMLPKREWCCACLVLEWEGQWWGSMGPALVSVLGWAPQAQHTPQPPLTSVMYTCVNWGTGVWALLWGHLASPL